MKAMLLALPATLSLLLLLPGTAAAPQTADNHKPRGPSFLHGLDELEFSDPAQQRSAPRGPVRKLSPGTYKGNWRAASVDPALKKGRGVPKRDTGAILLHIDDYDQRPLSRLTHQVKVGRRCTQPWLD